jgi:hypothetical protein
MTFIQEMGIHQGLVLCSSCVPEKAGINEELYAHKKKRCK